MYSIDIPFAGIPIDVVAAGGAYTPVGFRIIPVLAAGATVLDMLAAYALLQVAVSKANERFPAGITENSMVPGPDWVRTAGFGHLQLIGGTGGVTYRCWVATDCKEMVDVEMPMMYGFGSAGALPGATLAAPLEVNHLLAAPSIPALAGDGVSVSGAKAMRVSLYPVDALDFITAAGQLDGWVSLVNAGAGPAYLPWGRMPDIDLLLTAASTVANPRLTWAMPVLLPAGARVTWVPNGIVLGGTGAKVRAIVGIEVAQ